MGGMLVMNSEEDTGGQVTLISLTTLITLIIIITLKTEPYPRIILITFNKLYNTNNPKNSPVESYMGIGERLCGHDRYP